MALLELKRLILALPLLAVLASAALGGGDGNAKPSRDLAALPRDAAELAIAHLERAREQLLGLEIAGVPLPQIASACYTLLGWGLFCHQYAPLVLRQSAGLVRGLRFWQHALPIYTEYRLTQRRLRHQAFLAARGLTFGGAPVLTEDERDRQWDALHHKHAPNILRMALDLRGFYVKLGQVASTRGDMFPRPWTEALRQLQGEHPELLARPVDDVWEVLDRDLGPLAEELKDLLPEPVGAAATGQVHRARLEDGREVVVKVQYPEAQRLYRQDFANIKIFCRLLQPEHLSYIEELERQFYTEFDFRSEAADLAEISKNFAKDTGNPFADRVRVPEPVLELSSRNVVVMEYLPGETLLSYGLRKRRELEEASVLWRLGRGFFLLKELRAHLELLLTVQGYQIFVDGVFNGDPHPGNILLMPDGKLGLIDYGNVKRLSVAERARLGHLIIALADDDRAAVVKRARELGYRTRRNDPEVIFRLARLSFDRDDTESMTLPDGTVPANVQVYFESLAEMDPLMQMPPSIIMAARNSFLLRGLGTHFGLALRVASCWRHLAEWAVRRAELAAELAPTSASRDEWKGAKRFRVR